MKNDFIAVHDNVIDTKLCRDTIDYFEKAKRLGFVSNRQQTDKIARHVRDSESVFLNEADHIELSTASISNPFLNVMWNNVLRQYFDEYSVLHPMSELLSIYTLKLQKIEIGGGFHQWHHEVSTREVNSRVLMFIVYLNDVDEGGETEFLYIPKRVQARRGRVIVCPAGFTHTHRGNPPISNEKYIITGWVTL